MLAAWPTPHLPRPSPARSGTEAKGLGLRSLSWSDRLGRGRRGARVRDVEGQMTANRNLKRQVRARAAKTGESYTTALRHVRPAPSGGAKPGAFGVRLAVAQTIVHHDPGNFVELRESGHQVRRLMREAHQAGARIVHFTEGASCFPHKRVMSVEGPGRIGPADWSRFAWGYSGRNWPRRRSWRENSCCGPSSVPRIG